MLTKKTVLNFMKFYKTNYSFNSPAALMVTEGYLKRWLENCKSAQAVTSFGNMMQSTTTNYIVSMMILQLQNNFYITKAAD